MKKASLNLIDKAIAFINPQGAVDRLVARQKITNFQYDAVRYTRERQGPSALTGAEDFRSNYDRVQLMRRARDLSDNFGLVRSLLLKFAGHTAANISYQARTENPEVNIEVETYWAEWWDKCDITTRHTGSTLMQVAIMSMLRDGDFLFVLVRDSDGNLKIQGIEGDRLGDPFRVYTSQDLIGGIHIDQATGSPTAYDIYNRSFGDFYSFQTTIPASQAFHLFDPLRIDQYRGISAFHAAMNDCTDIYDIINFEKMAAKVASSQSAVVRRNNNNASDLSSLSTDQDINGNTVHLEAIESGKISYLEPGEDIVFPDGPSRPSGAFAEFHKILLRNICLGLGIPYSFAVDPSAMSGPTARLEMQQAGRTFRRYQKLLDDKVLRPIKNIVIADGVARGLIEKNVGSRTTRGIFNFGANVSIDLGRESASAISEFKTGLRTAADIYAERGQDFESSMRQRAIEAKLIKDLSEKYGVDPETISDIVPSKPTQTKPEAPSINPVIPAKDSPESDEDIGGDQKPIPEDPIEPSSEELEVKKKDTELDCGTGAGGFKEGNTCADGGGDRSEVVENLKNTLTDRKGDRRVKYIWHNINEDGKKEYAKAYEKESIAEEKINSVLRSAKTFRSYREEISGSQEDVLKKYNEDRFKIYKSIDPKFTADQYNKNQATLNKGAGGDIYDEVDLFIKQYRKNNDYKNPYDTKYWSKYQKKGKVISPGLVPDTLNSLTQGELKMLIAGMMGGIELGKYDGIDFTPPQGARDAAKRALNVRETKPSSQRGMTPVGIARARDLQNGVKMSPDTVRRMKAFFDRHEVDKKGATWDEQGKGWQAWHGWGGDAGYAWARKVVGQMEARDKQKEFVNGRDCGQDDGGTFGTNNNCAEGYGRPKDKGGYKPERPGGKFPKDYKRPTEQVKSTQTKKPLPPKPLPPKPLPPKPLPPKPLPPKTKEQTEREKKISEIAERFTKDGVTTSLPNNLDRAKEIETSYNNLKSRGYSVPPPDQILTANLTKLYGDESFAGTYACADTDINGKARMIFSNSFNDDGNKIQERLSKNVKDNWLASNDIFAHEYAHNIHIKSLGVDGNAKFNKEGFGTGATEATQKSIAAKVSKYAATDPFEFVAETFAGHVNGKKYDKDVYDLYEYYRGPKLK